MAERGDAHEGSPTRTPRRSVGATSRPAAGLGVGPDAAAGSTAAETRVVELEADLTAAKSTIDALLDSLERTVASPAPRDVNRGDAAPQTAIDAPSGKRAERGSEPIDGSARQELEQVIRQRTRALMEAEKQLEHKSSELDRLNEMKVEFISIATHELRTPLTRIVGYLDLLEEGRFGDVPNSMERPMASLRRNAHRLKRLVDEMLDVSRIDSGRVTLFRTRCELRGIIHQVVGDLQGQAAAKRQELSASLNDTPDIFADLERIRQVASKLIANAIRHTPEGGVITVILDTAPPETFAGVWARIRVKGTGITIPSDMRSRIFEPFSAVHKAKYHTSAGPDAAGLGLYIARGLVDLHGGLISVDSVEGAYTEFTVLLPQSEPTETEDP